MGKLNKGEVAEMLGITIRGMENNIFAVKNKKKDGRNIYWDSELVDEEVKRLRVEVLTSEKPEITTGDSWGLLKHVVKRYIRHQYKSGGFIYCKDIETNEWGDASDYFFNDLNPEYVRDIENTYLEMYRQGATRLLVSKEEVNSHKLDTLESKTLYLKGQLRSNTFFKVDPEDVQQFSNDVEEMKYKFFDLKTLRKGEHKHWSIFESQVYEGDRSTWRAFVYGIYVAKSRSRQVLWMVDPGDSGKTTVLNALGRFGGDHFTSSPKMKQLEDKHWGSYFDKYRLVTFDDMEDPFFLGNTNIKTITGSGDITVDRKNDPRPYKVEPNCKIVVGSNHRPILAGDKAEATRLILINVSKPTDENVEYFRNLTGDLSDILVNELPSYLYDCKKDYDKLCSADGRIRLSDKQMEAVSDCQNLDATVTSNFISSFFEYDKHSVIPKTAIDSAKEHYYRVSKNEIKYDKLLKQLQANGVTTIKSNKLGFDLQDYSGLKPKYPWRVNKHGRLEQLNEEDVKNNPLEL